MCFLECGSDAGRRVLGGRVQIILPFKSLHFLKSVMATYIVEILIPSGVCFQL